jgi:hypothetical protein
VCSDDTKRFEYDPGPGVVVENVFYSSLTKKQYSSTTYRGTDQWGHVYYFYLNYLGIDLKKEGIETFDDYKEKYIVPRGETIESLAYYKVENYTYYSQYLKERAKDLLSMGIDPHEISTYRYPEDDFYFFDLEYNFWVRDVQESTQS